MKTEARFEFVPDEGGTWVWILVGADGEDVASREGFLTLASARRHAKRIRDTAASAELR